MFIALVPLFARPQQAGQSNLTPAQGAELWQQYIEPLKAQGVRLGTPATSSAPSGKTWVQDWLSTCGGGCTPDFVALRTYNFVPFDFDFANLIRLSTCLSFHLASSFILVPASPADWYDVNATAFQEYLEDFHNTFQKPIWVTEWACQVAVSAFRIPGLLNVYQNPQNFNGGPQCSQQDIIDFLNQTQSFMDATDWVERYAWFGVMRDLQGVNPVRQFLSPFSAYGAD